MVRHVVRLSSACNVCTVAKKYVVEGRRWYRPRRYLQENGTHVSVKINKKSFKTSPTLSIVTWRRMTRF